MQTTPSIDSLGLLLDIGVKLSLILGLAFATTSALRRSSASMRRAVWNLAFASVLGLPLLALLLPSWRSTWLPSFLLGSEYRGADPLTVCAAWIDPSWPRLLAVLGERLPFVDLGVAEALLLVWGAGAAFLALRFMVQGLLYSWRCQAAQAVEDPELLALLDTCCADLGLKRAPLLLAGEFPTPATFGWHRPKVLLPEEALTWSPERLRVVLLHELAHICHGDYPFNLMVQWVCALNWYNPVVWMAARAMRLDRECAADDRVIDSGERELDYAIHLFEIASRAHRQATPALALSMAHACPLKTRVAQLLDPTTRRGPQGRALLLALAVVFLCTVGPLAAMQPQLQAPAPGAHGCKKEAATAKPKPACGRESVRDCERNREDRSCKRAEAR